MLSYQHEYHAGNFADVVKHIVLLRLLTYLIQKDKPIFYLETHAGRGLYDLQSTLSLKTGEAHEGIERVWSKRSQLPPIFSYYLNCIRFVNTSDKLRYYPGSLKFAIHALRTQDRIYGCELHPAEFKSLQQIQRENKRVFLSHSDGLKAMKALLPPPERRGLIFIDPSYEVKSDYQQIPILLQSAYQRFATGIYCLWYPIINNQKTLLTGLNRIEKVRSIRLEFNLNTLNKEGMTGCGLWIINPPYVLAAESKLIFETLSSIFNPGKASFLIHLQ